MHSTSSHCHLSINQVSIPFVLSKISPGQASIMTNTKLRGDNSISIQGRIMVLGFCPSSHCHISINHFNPFFTFQDMARTGNTNEKWLRGDNTVNLQGRIMVLGSALPLNAIYLYTKFDLNGNNSFKVICRTSYWD